MNEADKVIERYSRREKSNFNNTYYFHSSSEREVKYLLILKKYFHTFDNLKIMEIGAGIGGNLLALKRHGFQWNNLYANELLDDSVEVLVDNLPNSHIFPGDAADLEFVEEFDITFHSMVFTSILDDAFKQVLAKKMYSMTKKDGMVLWYDFKYNNPKNPDVRGIGKKEIEKLFPDAKNIIFHSVTLAPPIGRKIGNFYHFFNSFPFLRTHIIAEIHK